METISYHPAGTVVYFKDDKGYHAAEVERFRAGTDMAAGDVWYRLLGHAREYAGAELTDDFRAFRTKHSARIRGRCADELAQLRSIEVRPPSRPRRAPAP
jgi:hypothetical protein